MIITILTPYNGPNTLIATEILDGQWPTITQYEDITGAQITPPDPNVTTVKMWGDQTAVDALEARQEYEVLSYE